MAAQSIEWHEECLRGLSSSANTAYFRYREALRHFEQLNDDCDLLRRQIARAKRLGKKSFDADRFKGDE